MEHAESQSQSGKEGGGDIVPKVHLHATHEKALDVVGMDSLKKFAAEPEVGNASNVAQSRKGGSEFSLLSFVSFLLFCFLSFWLVRMWRGGASWREWALFSD